MSDSRGRTATATVALLATASLACAATPPEPARYRLTHSGHHWDVSGTDRVLEDVEPRYPEFFQVILDPQQTRLPNLLPLRDDLEHQPVDRRNFDALNAVAIGYFEINYRAESQRGDGLGYLGQSQRAAKLLALPWRGYGETGDDALRSAILDFFEDAVRGDKLATRATAGRVGPIVRSLDRKESDPVRVARIAEIAAAAESQATQQRAD